MSNKSRPVSQLTNMEVPMVMALPDIKPEMTSEQQARELLRRLISDSNVICYNDPLKREVESFLAKPVKETETPFVREGIVHKDIVETQREFEVWATEQGMPVGLAHYDQCDDGRYPATYQDPNAESAWRAWYKKDSAAQFRFEPILYVNADRLQDAIAAKQLNVHVHGPDAGLPHDVTLYRIAADVI